MPHNEEVLGVPDRRLTLGCDSPLGASAALCDRFVCVLIAARLPPPIGSCDSQQHLRRHASIFPVGIGGPKDWTSPQGLASTLQVMLLLTVVSLAPAILLMTTCFVRIIVVLGLLRQALGTQQLPPSQVITSISLFMTLLLMAPVWQKSYENGIQPYTRSEISLDEAFTRAVDPIRHFMADQLIITKNDDDVYLFLRYMPRTVDSSGKPPNYVYYEPKEGETDRAARGTAPRLHAQRAKDRVPDRLPDLFAVRRARHRRGQRHDLDGHADVAAGADLAAVQAAAVRAGRTAGTWSSKCSSKAFILAT